MPLLGLALLLLAAVPSSAAPTCSGSYLRELTAGCRGAGECSGRMTPILNVCNAEFADLMIAMDDARPDQLRALRERVRAFERSYRDVRDAERDILGGGGPRRAGETGSGAIEGQWEMYTQTQNRFDEVRRQLDPDGNILEDGPPPKGNTQPAPAAQEAWTPPVSPEQPVGPLNALAERYLQNGREEDARRVLDAAAEGGEGAAQSHALRAGLDLKQGRRDEALAGVERALKLDPNNQRAREIRSYLTGRSGDMKGATKLPDFGGAGEQGLAGRGGGQSIGRGGAGYAGGGFAPAAGGGANAPGGASGREAARAPQSPYQLLLTSARRKTGMGDFTGALLDCTRAIQAIPSDAEAFRLRAYVNNRLGQHDAALRDAEEALRLAPGDVAARLEKVYALIGLGRFAEALAEADSVLKEAPGNALAHLYRGMALIKLGRVAEGEAALDEAVRLDPSLRALADPLRSKKAAPAPERRVDPRKGLYVLCGLMALLLLLEGSKRVFKPGWRTTAPRPETEAPVPTGTLPPGTMLGGNYRVEKELARGGMGVVYRAQDVTLRRPVAIKQMRTGVPEIERFLREARLAAKLRHQNLAQIFSVIDAGRQPFLVFEFVEGEALDALLKRRGPLTLEEAVALLSPLAAALDYAHAQKVIHRDLKPANVMLSVDGVPKLMDFGIAHEARAAHGETRTEAWGTPPYMAPEQESGVVSRQSDLYALAVMAYELLTGKLPFKGTMEKINRSFVRPPDAKLAAVFEKAFDPLPAGRPESAAAFLASLRACLPG